MPDMISAAWKLLAELQTSIDVVDADSPHVVIQLEPETLCIQVIGPYPDMYIAMADLGRMREEIGEPIEFLVVPYFPAP